MYDEGLEQALLACALAQPSLLVELGVTREDFYLVRHQRVYDVVSALARAGKDVDLVSVNALLKREHIDVLDVVTCDHMLAHAPTYAALLKRLSARRRLAALLEETKAKLEQGGVSTSELVEAFKRDALALDVGGSGTLINAGEALSGALDVLEERASTYTRDPNYIAGISTGLAALDRRLDGLPAGAITTLAGATGAGKSALALTIALNAARWGLARETLTGARVWLFSGEMTQTQLNDRLLAMTAGVEAWRVRRGALTREHALLLRAAVEAISALPLCFEQLKTLSPAALERSLLRAHERPHLIVLDGLLQLDAFEGLSEREQWRLARARRDALEHVMRRLEVIAARFNVAILLTHQLSREPARRHDHRPRLSDLGEASFVERTSAVVVLMHRPALYDENEDPSRVELVVAKNRFGEIGACEAIYDAQYVMFHDKTNQEENHVQVRHAL
jgi:replicative DNA helicase